jgi:hypothetical protein
MSDFSSEADIAASSLHGSRCASGIADDLLVADALQKSCVRATVKTRAAGVHRRNL